MGVGSFEFRVSSFEFAERAEADGGISRPRPPKPQIANRKSRGPATTLAIACALTALLLASPARAQNLLIGDMEKWNKENNEPVGWNTHLTSIIPIPEYKDHEKKEGRTGVFHYKCGCGNDWGTVRPWAGLLCPKCRNLNTGLEDSGDFYLKNFECVHPVPGHTGQAAGIKLPKDVAENQGVRIISNLVKAERGAGYEISVDGLSKGPHLRVFVECFKLMDDDEDAKRWIKTFPPDCNPMYLTGRLRRSFRQSINLNSPAAWTTFKERFANTLVNKSYQFDYMNVTLFAYYPVGEAAYDNVVLRKLTAAELQQYLKENPPKDTRAR